MMEAMATGRPVVGTYVAGVPELVINGENGWLVPASSADDLAGAIKRVLHTPAEELTRMSEAARRQVGERHDVRNEAEKLKGHFLTRVTLPES